MYRLICQKPAHFLSAQTALVSTFFQMLIVLGMYNFGYIANSKVACTALISWQGFLLERAVKMSSTELCIDGLHIDYQLL